MKGNCSDINESLESMLNNPYTDLDDITSTFTLDQLSIAGCNVPIDGLGEDPKTCGRQYTIGMGRDNNSRKESK